MVGLLETGIRSLVEDFVKRGCPCSSGQSVDARRAGYLESASLAGPTEAVYQEWTETIEGYTFQLYRPSDKKGLPLILYFHGGCFISGSHLTHQQQLRALSTQTECVVACLSYRLAPEHTYPAAHNDVFSAAQVAREYADLWYADAKKIHFVGDSAGGQLALATALRLKQEGKWQASSLSLIYPMLDPYGQSESYRELGKSYLITGNMLLSGFDMYRRGLTPEEAPELYLLEKSDFTNLPPTHILTAEFDPLKDEGEALNFLLRQKGVSTHYQLYPGVIHGFYQLSGISEAARRSIGEVAKFIRSF